jgi:hypothetical protein
MIPIDTALQVGLAGLSIGRDLTVAWKARRTGKGADQAAVSRAPLGQAPPAPLPPAWQRWAGARPEPRGAPANSILAVPGLASTTPALRAALLDLAEELGIPVDSLAVVISSESRFNPKALNPLPAAGLIQLTVGAHLPGYGTKEAIRAVLQLSPEEQIRQVVRPYYQRMKAGAATPGHLYMLNFLPHRAGGPEDTVLGRRDATGFDGAVYRENSGFDREKKGTITTADVYTAAAAIARSARGRRIAVDGSVFDPGGPTPSPASPAQARPTAQASPPTATPAQALPPTATPAPPATAAAKASGAGDPRRPDSARGRLLLAAQRGEFLAVTWAPVRVGPLEILVTTDALRAPVPELDAAAVRLPVSYSEQIAIAKLLRAIAFTQLWWDATFAAAAIKLAPEPLPAGPSMGSLEYAVRYSRSVDAAIARANGLPGQLVRDVGKGWILHPRLVETGAVNYGWIQASGKPIQTPGGRHDPSHQDYSQTCVLVQRSARLTGNGFSKEVDLLDHLAELRTVPAKFLDVYR